MTNTPTPHYSLLTFYDDDTALPIAREIASKTLGPLRCPHHSCSALSMVKELAIAANGVLLVDNATDVSDAALSALSHTARQMICAPVVILWIGRGVTHAQCDRLERYFGPLTAVRLAADENARR